jgi:glutamine synthetase
MLEGIEKQMDPGAPIVGNGYEQIEPSLPTNWPDALAAADASDFLSRRLGARFTEIYLAIKRAECERFFAEIPDLDYSLYLRLA